MATLASIPMRLTLRGALISGTMIQAVLSIGHPMESGFRTLDSGGRVPKNIIEKITVQLAGELLFEIDSSIGLSAHPYLVFPVQLPEAMPSNGLRLAVRWLDDQGQQGALSRELALEVR
jgi:sulfur-oxidizing protein SoxZ